MEMRDTSVVDCYLPVTLQDCSRGVVIEIATKITEKESVEEKYTIKDTETKACLKTKCTRKGSTLSLAYEVDIGGETGKTVAEATPDDIQAGDDKVKDLFQDEQTCSNSDKKPAVSVKCEQQLKGEHHQF